MKRARIRLSILALLGMAACGGRAIEDPGSGGSEPSAPAPTSTSTGTAGKSGNPSDSLPTQPLGACKPGFNRAQNPMRPCHWSTEAGLCFDDTDQACACICPTDRDSLCWHGFDSGPNSAELVHCD